MPEHLIFDLVAALRTQPLPAGPPGSALLASPQLAASAPPPPSGPYQPGQRPPVPGQRPGPPGQRPGPPGPPGPRSGPPIPPYGPGGRGPGGPGGYPPQSGGDGGPFGSRRNLILAIVGGVVLVGAAIGIGFWLATTGHHGHAAPRRAGQRTARVGDGRAQLPAAEHPVRVGVTLPVTVDQWWFDGARRVAGRSTARSEPDRRAHAHRRRRRGHATRSTWSTRAVPGRRRSCPARTESWRIPCCSGTGPPSSSSRTGSCT